jgi:hypothetical protein
MLARSAKVKKLCFFHHDPDHTDEFLDCQIDISKNRIAQDNADIDCFGAQEGMEIEI